MNLKSKNIPLITLAVTSVLISRLMFVFLNDPEGPNLLVVLVAAAILYFLSLGVYLFKLPLKTLNKLILVILIQVLLAAGFYFWSR